jgi:hypothetical protein
MVSKSMTSTPRDTKIPSGYIPLIILHWMDEHYQGGGFTIKDMRDFLETKLREGTFTRDAVKTWINQSEAWEFTTNLQQPGKVAELLGEYLEIKMAA